MLPAKRFRSLTSCANCDHPQPRNIRILAAVSRPACRGAAIGAKELSPLVGERFSSFASFQIHRQTELVGARGRSLSRCRQIFWEHFSLGVDWNARGIQQVFLIRFNARHVAPRSPKPESPFPAKHGVFGRVRAFVKAADVATAPLARQTMAHRFDGGLAGPRTCRVLRGRREARSTSLISPRSIS